jgi:hypothetical protein
MSYTKSVLELQAPFCTDPEVKPISLYGTIFLGAEGFGGPVGFYRYVDPVLETIEDTLNVEDYLREGKRIFLVKSPSGNLTILGVPWDNCATKEIWIKNTTDNILTVDNGAGTIDGKPNAILQTRESLHLVYAVSDNEWVII